MVKLELQNHSERARLALNISVFYLQISARALGMQSIIVAFQRAHPESAHQQSRRSVEPHSHA